MSKSVSLNRHKRDQIKKQALDEVFGPREAKLTETQVGLAFDIRNEWLAENGYFECIQSLPSSLVHAKPRLRVVYGDGQTEVEELPFDPESRTGRFSNGKIYAAPRNGIALNEVSRSLQGRFHAMRQERQRIKEQREDLAATLDGLLWSVRTTKQLLEEWPEAEKFLPQEAQTSNLPAVRGADVAAKINAYTIEEMADAQ
jgi:hypothetical protein